MSVSARNSANLNSCSDFFVNTLPYRLARQLSTDLRHTHTNYYEHACKTSAHAQGLYFQNGGCECILHNKNAIFELKSNVVSIQNFKAGNVKPPGMHWSKDF